MKLELYLRSLIGHPPTVGLVRWENRSALSKVISSLPVRLKKLGGGKFSVVTISANELSGAEFSRKLLLALGKAIPSNFLVIYDIEPLVGIAAPILNGYRERLGKAAAVLICLRINRFRDFAINAPDLVSWIGCNVADASDLTSSIQGKYLRKALKVLELKHGVSTDEFLKLDCIGLSKAGDDAWLWRELVAIDHDLEQGSKT